MYGMVRQHHCFNFGRTVQSVVEVDLDESVLGWEHMKNMR
jgi:hypothetical protein